MRSPQGCPLSSGCYSSPVFFGNPSPAPSCTYLFPSRGQFGFGSWVARDRSELWVVTQHVYRGLLPQLFSAGRTDDRKSLVNLLPCARSWILQIIKLCSVSLVWPSRSLGFTHMASQVFSIPITAQLFYINKYYQTFPFSLLVTTFNWCLALFLRKLPQFIRLLCRIILCSSPQQCPHLLTISVLIPIFAVLVNNSHVIPYRCPERFGWLVFLYPSYQKMISCYSSTLLLYLVQISSYLRSCNSPLLSHVPKPFPDNFPTLLHHAVNLRAISDSYSWGAGFNKNLCSATSLPHCTATSFSQTWISGLCPSVLTRFFQEGCEGSLLCGRASSLGVQKLCKAGPPRALVWWWKKPCQRTGLGTATVSLVVVALSVPPRGLQLK